jgi:hypothetical protein
MAFTREGQRKMQVESNLSALVELNQGFLGDSYSLTIWRRSLDLPDGQIHVVKDITMQTMSAGSIRPADAPAMLLSKEGCTALMDSLWRAGIRPSTKLGMDQDTRNALTALVMSKDDHIKDLRAIVFNRLGVEQGV